MRTLAAGLVMLTAVGGGWAAGAAGVPLKVTEPVGVARTQAPVIGGVPVGPLGVKEVKDLVLLDAQGRAVAAQLSPMVTHEDGRLLWILVDFLADLKPGETKTFALKKGGAAAPGVKRPVTVRQTAHALTLANGVVQVALSKTKFNLFDQVWVDRNEDGEFADDERMLAQEQIPALRLLRGQDPAAFTSRDGTVEQVTLEDPGPVRTTVRIDGTFGDGKGRQWLKYTTRITLWAGRPDIRVLYTLRNVNPNVETQEQIRHGAVTVKLVQPTGMTHYLVGAQQPMFSQITAGEKGAIKGSQWHSKVRLAQVGPPEAVLSRTHRQFYNLKDFEDAGFRVEHFQPSGRTPVADVGFKASGWIDLAGDQGGCQVWLRNFAYDCPKQMEASAHGQFMVEVIPVYAGNQQPYYANGGYWLGDRSHWSYELNFHFHGKPLVKEADWAAYRNEFSAYVPATPETAARTEGIARQAGNPLQLVATPEWYTRTGQMWGPVVSMQEELAAAKAMGRTKIGPVRVQPACALATDHLHYENFHYRSEWDEPRDAIVEYLRTGEWHFYRRAHSFARNYRDVGVPRTDGLTFGQRARGTVKGAGPIARWGKFCGCHNYGAGLIDMWLITGDRSYREAGVEYGYEHAKATRVWGGFGGKGRGWARKMASVLRTYDVTRDPKLKAWLIANCRPPVPDEALRADSRGLIAGKLQGSWMATLCHHAIWHNWRLNGDAYTGVARDDFLDGIIGMARNVAKYWYFPQFNGGPYYITFDTPKPGDVSANGGGASYTSSCIDTMTRGYLLTGDPYLLERAKRFWDCVNGKDKAVLSARLQDFSGMGSNGFWARQLILELAHPRTDREPPARVTDLKVEALGGGNVRLTWTAPTDRGGGAVVSYQVKHAPRPFVTFNEYEYPRDHGTKWTWWAGYNVAGEPKPGTPGTTETMVLTGIPAGTRHFCLRAKDGEPNESEMSNCVKVEVK